MDHNLLITIVIVVFLFLLGSAYWVWSGWQEYIEEDEDEGSTKIGQP